MVIAPANNFSRFFPAFRIMISFSYPVVLPILLTHHQVLFLTLTGMFLMLLIRRNISFGVTTEVLYLVTDLFI